MTYAAMDARPQVRAGSKNRSPVPLIPGERRIPGATDRRDTLTTTTITHRRWGVALAGLTMAAVLAACSAATAGGSAVPPSDPPASPAPTTPAPTTPTPDPTPEPEPTDGGSDAMPITVDLETVNGADVVIDIVDRTGDVVDAHSGTPGDGASVPPYEVRVEHIDPQTLRLTWVEYPHANRLGMWIEEVDGVLRSLIVQPEPTGPTDSIALDRVLEVTFDHVIDEVEVQAVLQDGLDTAA